MTSLRRCCLLVCVGAVAGSAPEAPEVVLRDLEQLSSASVVEAAALWKADELVAPHGGGDKASVRDRRARLRGADPAPSAAGTSIGLVLATLGGAFSASGANLMAWSAFRTRVTGQEWSVRANLFFAIGCVVLNLVGVTAFAAACALGGAVATVMPVQTASSLLTNMFLQVSLGMKRFTKSMRVGTFVLLCAVAELGELGPQEPDDLDAVALLQTPIAMAWVSCLIVGGGLSLAACYATYAQPLESIPKCCAFVLQVSITTVIGSSTAKCFSLLSGWPLVLAFAIYFVDGIFCMAFTVLANRVCDVSVYIPAQLSLQLVINMFTGYLVWGDAAYIEKPVSYVLVYVIAILGVYLINPECDIISQLAWRRCISRTKISQGETGGSALGQALLNVMDGWRRDQSGAVGDASLEELERRRKAIGDALRLAAEREVISQRELLRLVDRLLEARGSGSSAILLGWLEEEVRAYDLYTEHDPELRGQMRSDAIERNDRCVASAQ